ncbi:UNVERIFIED_CONTAM: hypothetical protein GTU68_002072 [Idotea baltica]|nr:hypothetical protein [Idotea baltica]
MRRLPSNPVPYFGEDLKAETVKRTIYCKGLPRDGSVNLDILLEHFNPYGPYETIHMRQYFDRQTKKQGFKGSILIVFPDVEKAQEFIEIDDVKFGTMPLLRKWHQDYLLEKQEEFQERKARKEARLEQEGGNGTNAPTLAEIDPIPRGSFIFASGFTNTTTREDIKAELVPYTQDVAFLDFAKGNTEGYIRLSTPNSNQSLVDAIQGKFKVNDADITVRVVEGKEEDEQVKKAEIARTKVFSQSSRKRKFGGGGRGRGGRNQFKRKKF